MTHQPPVPEAATSPYPLHPDPIPEEQKIAAAEAAAAAEAEQARAASGGISSTAIGIGAAIGLSAAAVVTGLIYARGRSSKSVPARRERNEDGKRTHGSADRKRVAAGEPYEVSYFARKHRISAAEARSIIKQAGPSRAAANALAVQRKAG